MSNQLATCHPAIGEHLPVVSLADLPTPVSLRVVDLESNRYDLAIKHDNLTARHYGGNKVRKLEYLLYRARQRGAKRIATFGAVGSNHAMATALYSGRTGFDCTCFLSHQAMRPGLARALRFHQQAGTELVYLGGARARRIATLREHLWGRDAWVIPLGGSSWLGSVGFVNAGLELAEQVRAGAIPCPQRIYVAMGTMGTATGLALGLALAGLDIEVHAVRVTDRSVANETAAARLLAKTAALLRAIDATIPENIARRTRLVCRNEFFGEGYGRSNAATDAAVHTAHEQLGLSLESTYTGKAMAALLNDLRAGFRGSVLFWNTYNSRPLDIDDGLEPDFDVVPQEFARYF